MLVARAGELIKWEGGAAIPLEMAGGIQCHTRWLFPVQTGLWPGGLYLLCPLFAFETGSLSVALAGLELTI